MWCPSCSSEQTRVVGTEKSAVVERYRKCMECNHSFVTIESVKFDPKWQENAKYTAEERARIMKKYQHKQKDLFDAKN